ncbi:hypothetical protein F2Q70_00003669 [Brassica cretica]|uniref:RNase H type-1 domain-containing protein n=1 Tax=Brassica cretica TaxID=69181 RepID=A0A8S9IT29_BRACR|nr:hypothetical protein F2Q70_00003669 [Brassica cretica]
MSQLILKEDFHGSYSRFGKLGMHFALSARTEKPNNQSCLRQGSILVERWKPHPWNMIKINVGASWDGDTMISGASWINRNSQDQVFSHSRRSYSGVNFFLEAEFLATFRAIEAVKNLRLNSVILEVIITSRNVHLSLNRVAPEVVASVTRDLRLHSYVASGGLRWLTPLINLEAAENGHALRQ